MDGPTWWTGEENPWDRVTGKRTTVWHRTSEHVGSGEWGEALCGKRIRSLASGLDSADRLSRDGNAVCQGCQGK